MQASLKCSNTGAKRAMQGRSTTASTTSDGLGLEHGRVRVSAPRDPSPTRCLCREVPTLLLTVLSNPWFWVKWPPELLHPTPRQARVGSTQSSLSSGQAAVKASGFLDHLAEARRHPIPLSIVPKSGNPRARPVRYRRTEIKCH